jgi:hypothetical protein
MAVRPAIVPGPSDEEAAAIVAALAYVHDLKSPEHSADRWLSQARLEAVQPFDRRIWDVARRQTRLA